MKKLSLVVPCFNEQESIPFFYPAVQKVLITMPEVKPEYWFVDDGSKDGTLSELKKLHEQDQAVHYISFSRNFGKEAAIYAGLSAATGDYVALMDVDLQDPPDLLPKMYEILQTGEYDAVGCRRVDRKGERKVKSFLSNQFYKVINRVSKVEIVPGARDYRMMTRQMVNAVLAMKEYSRFSKGILLGLALRLNILNITILNG